MNKFGIGNVSYTPICSSEEIKLEMKKPTGNEIVKKMWDKLDDEEQGFINVMIDRDNKQNEEIERLHSIIKEAREYIDNDVEVYYVLDTRLKKAFDKTKKVKKDLLQILDKVGGTDDSERNV